MNEYLQQSHILKISVAEMLYHHCLHRVSGRTLP